MCIKVCYTKYVLSNVQTMNYLTIINIYLLRKIKQGQVKNFKT